MHFEDVKIMWALLVVGGKFWCVAWAYVAGTGSFESRSFIRLSFCFRWDSSLVPP